MSATNNAEPESDQTDIELGRLGDFVGFRLRRIQNQLSRNFATVTAEHELRHGLFSALAIVAANPGLSQIAIAREIGLDKSLAVTIIDDLERRNWARRERSPTDRRRHALYITDKGEAALDDMFGKLEDVEHDALEALSTSERRVLADLLDRIYTATFR